jgi:hypothetical protein
MCQAYSLEVPTVDHSTLEDQAGKVEREANRIRTEAQRLIQTNQVCHFIMFYCVNRAYFLLFVKIIDEHNHEYK